MFEVSKLVRPCILARKEYVPGKPIEEVMRETGITDLIKVASNENALGASPLALEAMISEIRNSAHRYPDSLCHDFREKLSRVHGLSAEQFFIDNGEDGVITMLGLTFINPKDEVILGTVSFPAFENIATKMDGVCIRVPMTADYRLDLNGFCSALSERTKMVFLCNPNNPTGTIVRSDEFNQLLEALPESAILVSDEAYCDFADSPEYPQTLSYLSSHPNLIILRSFSKIMGLAGVRIGYAIANPDVVRMMLKSREPFPVNRLAQVGAMAALDDTEFVRRTIDVTRRGRDQLYAGFEEMGLRFFRSQANFVMVDLGLPAQPIFQAMLMEGVIVRPLTSFDLPNCLRITVGTPGENRRTLQALAKALRGSAGAAPPPG
ncbi:MAG: histidinol-phosphate transaminase [Spirochaetes bacterium GWB1_59_5]|nr:MAG: histidinol-phosphate transaminase [Spirochaetes bacterium GWB1_59_5]